MHSNRCIHIVKDDHIAPEFLRPRRDLLRLARADEQPRMIFPMMNEQPLGDWNAERRDEFFQLFEQAGCLAAGVRLNVSSDEQSPLDHLAFVGINHSIFKGSPT